MRNPKKVIFRNAYFLDVWVLQRQRISENHHQKVSVTLLTARCLYPTTIYGEIIKLVKCTEDELFVSYKYLRTLRCIVYANLTQTQPENNVSVFILTIYCYYSLRWYNFSFNLQPLIINFKLQSFPLYVPYAFVYCQEEVRVLERHQKKNIFTILFYFRRCVFYILRELPNQLKKIAHHWPTPKLPLFGQSDGWFEIL